MITFKIVPMPAFCCKGIHKSKTARLIKKVRAPMLNSVTTDRPSAKTVHGLIPMAAVMIKDSPSPNNTRPIQSIKIVRGSGEKFNGFFELHAVTGTDLTEKIFILFFIIVWIR